MSVSVPVILLDPGNFTPDYDERVLEGLRRFGWDAICSTSEHAFESNQKGEHDFYRELSGLNGLPAPLRRLVKLLLYPIGLWRLHRRLRALSAGIVHVQWSLIPWLDVLVWQIWKRRGWKIVYTAHDVVPQAGTMPGWYAGGLRLLARQASAVVVHSRFGSRVLIRMGVPAERIHLMPMGPCLPRETVPLGREAARKQLDLPLHRPLLMFLGYVKPYKGLELLLQALHQIQVFHPDVSLVIAGQDSDGYLRSLERRARRLGLEESVIWRPGYVASSEVASYLYASDIVVLPYQQVTFSAAAIAAAYCGRAVVATRVGGLAEAVLGGVVVPKKNAAELASAVCDLLESPSWREQLEQDACRRAGETHRWGLLCRQLDDLYRNLLSIGG